MLYVMSIVGVSLSVLGALITGIVSLIKTVNKKV